MISNVRAMTSNDLSEVFCWRNHPNIRKYMLTNHEISFDEHINWFDQASKDSTRKLLIYEQDGGPMGFISFKETSFRGVVDWGFYVKPTAPRGTGRLLGMSSLSYAFLQLRFHKVNGQALAYNPRSISCHIGLGFKEEGIIRKQYFDGATYHDIHIFGLLQSEFMSTKSV